MARVLRTSVVSPSPSGAALRERSLPLTYMDAMWLHTSPVERVFFFDHDDARSDAILSNLEVSLSEALCSFFPLAGRLRLVPGAPKQNRHELHYRPGDGVTFTVAECLRGLDELAADQPRELAMVAPLVQPLPEGGAVLALQATVLRRGLALGVAVHHAACDGACSAHFLHTCAAAARQAGGPAPELLAEPPVIGRDFVHDRDDLYDAFAAPRPYSDDARRILKSDADDKLLATFTLSAEHLQCIKDTVAREAACHYQCRGVSSRCTSIVAAYGFIWQCYHRAKQHGSGSSPERVYIVFPTDHRARLDPPVPANYLGNFVGLCFGSASKADLAAPGAAGLLAACSAVGAAVDDAVRRGPAGFWDGCLERVVEAFGAGDGDMPLTVAGSPRFRVYGVDFGFGTPAKVDVVSVARTGAMSVAEARGGSGGGEEVGISLPPDAMRRFQSCFADATLQLNLTGNASP